LINIYISVINGVDGYINKLIGLTEQIREVRLDYWFNEVVFTTNWWFLLLLSIIPWVLWIKFIDPKRLFETLFYGSLISIYSILLDDIGSYYLCWIYQYQLVPISSRLNPVDLALMPVTYMVVYQYFKSWKTFFIAQSILSFGAAFLFEPLFEWLHIYRPIHWYLIYSFIIYLVLGIFNKWFVSIVNKKLS